ncbi:MFS transporter, sugar porter (SP) family [Microbulbifer thermotolerans]|uniref:MFS transporter n=1 Tax=Microbulbifer thermotolerans TaxID=252514 RepID=UPI0008F336FB|nr:MFS transporter [Microbulbifer thermotolerans]SFC75702.1 MFS transporter, sugar porter (SP) family [Microbulbifer thermotolerans]
MNNNTADVGTMGVAGVSQVAGNAGSSVTRFALIAAFGSFVFGLDAANISGAVRFVSSQFELSAMQVGTLVGCAIVGVILALFFTGGFCERFGRKKILLAIAATYSLSTLISAFATGYTMLVIGRFIGGVAFASITVSAMYIGEVAPPDKRGKFVAINQLLITIGSLLAFIVNFFLVKALAESSWLNNDNVWRFMLGFELLPNIIWFSLLLTIPESPRWLVTQGRIEEARDVFSRVGPASHADRLVASVRESIDRDSRNTTVAQLKCLFGKPMRLVLALAVCYAVVQGATGMNAVLFYAPTVFEQVGMSVEDSFMQTVVLGAVAVIFTLVAITCVEKLGRRFLTLVGLALIAVAHVSTWYGFDSAHYTLSASALETLQAQQVDTAPLQSFVGKVYEDDVALKQDLAAVYSKKDLPLVSGAIINATIDINGIFVLFGIFAFLAAFNMSIGPVMWVIFSEVFSSRVRSVAMPFAALVQSISSYLIQQFFPWQLENLGAANTFLNYGALAFGGLIIMLFLLPETKNKSIEQIEKDLVYSRVSGASQGSSDEIAPCDRADPGSEGKSE